MATLVFSEPSDSETPKRGSIEALMAEIDAIRSGMIAYDVRREGRKQVLEISAGSADGVVQKRLDAILAKPEYMEIMTRRLNDGEAPFEPGGFRNRSRGLNGHDFG